MPFFPVLQLVLRPLLCGCVGCAVQPAIEFRHVDTIPASAKAEAERISRDPVSFLREVLVRCSQVESYEVDFYKQERTGFLNELRSEEHMRVKFRAQPFSVKMTMLAPESDIAETLYVDGQNENRLRCRWRKSLWPGAPPPVRDYDPGLAVLSGKSLNPITDFGIERLMERVVRVLDDMTARGLPPEVRYLGITDLEKESLAVHHVQLQYDADTRLPHLKVDLFFHVDSLLPAASYVWRTDELLKGKYIYTRFDLHPAFTEEDFKITTSLRHEAS